MVTEDLRYGRCAKCYRPQILQRVRERDHHDYLVMYVVCPEHGRNREQMTGKRGGP